MADDLHRSAPPDPGARHHGQRALERAIAAAATPAATHAFLSPRASPARARLLRPTRRSPPAATGRSPGWPVSLKDLFDVAGEATRAGSVVAAERPPARADAPAVARLRAAGAAFVGRTNMTEFAFSGVGINPHYGTPANPCDCPVRRRAFPAARPPAPRSRSPPAPPASRSARTPAARSASRPRCSGIVGFKSTARLVPTEGAFPLSTTLDTVCAMTRSVPRRRARRTRCWPRARSRCSSEPLAALALRRARPRRCSTASTRRSPAPSSARCRRLRAAGARIERSRSRRSARSGSDQRDRRLPAAES